MNMQVSTNPPASQPPLQTLSTAPSDKLQDKQGGASAPIKITPNMPFNEGGVEIGLSVRDGGRGFFAPPKDQALTIKTGDSADKVHIKKSADGGLTAEINGKTYDIPFDTKSKGPQRLEIHTNGGDDNISIAPDVNMLTTIHAGGGNDTIKAGGGWTRAFGGKGNDSITLGAGIGYAEGNDGNDSITAGTGYSVMYGGNGNDKLRGGSGGSYMDGGSGDDQLHGGSGRNVLVGGKGNDILNGGSDQNAIYTGSGQDAVNSTSDKDVVYGKKDDSIKRSKGSKFVEVVPSERGSKAFNVKGTEEFKQHFEDDLEFLRGSPVGKKMLEALDKTVTPISVEEKGPGTNSAYVFGKNFAEIRPAPDAEHGYIVNGKPGKPADEATIGYNRTFVDGDEKRPPVIPLFHEMGHAYNGVTGTNLPGDTLVEASGRREENRELQVVGLPTNAEPFDFDNDPSTPPTAMNPTEFTENGLHAEMGSNKREVYDRG